jgi:hypothetical protein
MESGWDAPPEKPAAAISRLFRLITTAGLSAREHQGKESFFFCQVA